MLIRIKRYTLQHESFIMIDGKTMEDLYGKLTEQVLIERNGIGNPYDLNVNQITGKYLLKKWWY